MHFKSIRIIVQACDHAISKPLTTERRLQNEIKTVCQECNDCCFDYAVADDIIRIASPYKVQNLDPVRSAAAGTIELYGQLYSRVLRLDSDGKLAPGLASSWEVSDGGKTITLTLRNAKFSDGSPITADDVVFSLLRMIANRRL